MDRSTIATWTVLLAAGMICLGACGGPGGSTAAASTDPGAGTAATSGGTDQPSATVGEPAAGSAGAQPQPAPTPVTQPTPAPTPTPTPTPPPSSPAPPDFAAGYKLVWADEFDGNALDPTKWTYVSPGEPDHGGDVSDPASISVANGMLTDTVFTDSAGIQHIGMIYARGLYAFRYGYAEASIQMNGQAGAWCAFWLQTPGMGADPATTGTEMDVIEHRAYDWGDVYIGAQGAANVNWGSYLRSQRSNAGSNVWAPNGVPLQNQWHTYGLLWTSSKVTWYIDRQPVWSETVAVSQTNEFPMLTCQAKDQYWAGNVPPGGFGSLATSKVNMKVDYVRVWQP